MTIPAVTAALLLALGPDPAADAAARTPGSPSVTQPADTVPGTHRIRDSRQHVLVVVETPSTTTGTLHRLEITEAGWRRIGPAVPVVVGRAGVGPKREGDGRSPRGIFRLSRAFGYASAAPDHVDWPYRAMAPGTVCVDDQGSRHYDRIVAPEAVDSVDWTSAEAMRRDRVHGDDLYEWGIGVDHNPDRRPGAGSCIFLHVWRGPESPTAGCTAMPEEHLLELMAWLDAGDRPVLIQGTRVDLERLRADGLLLYPVPGPVPR